MTQIVLPNTSKSTTDANLFSDVYDNDNAIKSVVNGNIDNSNISGSAGIGLSKLGTGSSGQLLVCNASGIVTAVTMSGDATLAASGAVTVGSSKITTTKINDGAVVEAKLASPNNDSYKLLHDVAGTFGNAAAADTYFLGEPSHVATGDDIVLGGRTVPLFRLVANDHDVAGLTTNYLMRVQIACNATAPATNFLVSLYSPTVAGAADKVRFAAGGALASSTATITAPDASDITSANTGDFTVAASDTEYAVGFVTSSGIAADAMVQISAQLYYHNV